MTEHHPSPSNANVPVDNPDQPLDARPAAERAQNNDETEPPALPERSWTELHGKDESIAQVEAGVPTEATLSGHADGEIGRGAPPAAEESQ